MKKIIVCTLFSLCSFVILINGAIYNVGSGEDIQSAIDGASAGDTIRLTAPYDYAGSLTIGKALQIISLYKNDHNIVGNLTISDLLPNAKVRLTNVSVTGKVQINSSSVDIVRCDFHEVNATNPTGADTQLTVVQSNISDRLSSTLARSWIGYSNLRENYFEGLVEFVGNDVNGSNLGGIGLDLFGEQTVVNIYNNLIHDFTANVSSESCIGIRIDGNATAKIINNSIVDNNNLLYLANNSWQTGLGILIKSTKSTTITANVFDNNTALYGSGGTNIGSMHIYSHSQNVSIRYNAFQNNEWFVAEVKPLGIFGVSAYDSIVESSLNETEFLASTTSMAQGKASSDKGPPDTIHFDHDGSRNDIGPNGGHNFIPNGRTTDKPIPITFDLSLPAVPIGGTISMESSGIILK